MGKATSRSIPDKTHDVRSWEWNTYGNDFAIVPLHWLCDLVHGWIHCGILRNLAIGGILRDTTLWDRERPSAREIKIRIVETEEQKIRLVKSDGD